MELCSDAEKLSLLQDVRTLLGNQQPGMYPRRELAWLLTSAWNRGCHHAKYRRLREAQQFMEAALSLVEFCPEYQSREQVGRATPLLYIITECMKFASQSK